MFRKGSLDRIEPFQATKSKPAPSALQFPGRSVQSEWDLRCRADSIRDRPGETKPHAAMEGFGTAVTRNPFS